MPKRPHIDDAIILADYAETLSNRATARRLGIHENTVILARRTAVGLCRRCGNNPATPGTEKCDTCREKSAVYAITRRAAKIKQGLCPTCSEPAAPNSRHCERHQALIAADKRARRATAIDEDREAVLLRESYERRSASYGRGAIKALEKSNGHCVACSREYRKGKTHIHHIDGDHANRAESNVVPLCKECHNLLHYLTEWHYDLPAALLWIMNTYPPVAEALRTALEAFDAQDD